MSNDVAPRSAASPGETLSRIRAETAAFVEKDEHQRAANEALVLAAINDIRWDFWTVTGISKETGLSEDSVLEVLSTRKDAVRLSLAMSRNGEWLYTRADKPVSARERFATIVQMISA